MSVVSRVLLLLLLLCTDTLHNTYARSLTGAISKENREKMLPLPNKHDYKVSHVKLSVRTKSNPNMKGSLEDTIMNQIRVDKKDQSSKNSKTKELKGKATKNSNSKRGDDGSLVSISWTVPHHKRGEEQPGFNLDYSPPREHPGHHN